MSMPGTRQRRRAFQPVALCAVVALGSGCLGATRSTDGRSPTVDEQVATETVAPNDPAPSSPQETGDTEPAKRATALQALSRLPVRGRAAMTGYDRSRFGQAWLDADRNGCDTRNDMLGAQLTSLEYKPGTGQ